MWSHTHPGSIVRRAQDQPCKLGVRTEQSHDRHDGASGHGVLFVEEARDEVAQLIRVVDRDQTELQSTRK